jgi:outer membrane protein
VRFSASGFRVALNPRALKRTLRKTRRTARAGAPTILCVVVLFSLAGCSNFGAGGTGEMVIPPERFHAVQALELQKAPMSQASTVPTTQPASDTPPPELVLSLEECRAIALKNNLDLKVDLYTPAMAHTSVTEEQAAFEAVIGANTFYSRNVQPASVFVASENLQSDASLSVPLRTGGFLRLDVPLERLLSSGAPSSQNPTYLTTPNIALQQPLLRGFGPEMAAQGIRLAFYQYQQSEARTKLAVIGVLADTDRAYWALYAARQLLDVRKKQYDSAVAQLERARREARAGVIAEVDIVRAESGVADQVEAIILAENSVRLQQRNLKHSLNKAGLEMDTPTVIIPATRPTDFPLMLNRDHLQTAALNQRMEMLDVQLQLAQELLNVNFARNQMLPLLTLTYNYGRNGNGHTLGGTFDQVWDRTFDSHTVGLQLELPIGNEAAHSRLRRAMLSRLQQLATREQRAAQVRQDVLNAIDSIETDWQRILASRERVRLAARTLDVETHQFELGLRTSTDVLIAQASLADAQSSEVTAITDYQVAQVDLAVATGTTLGASRVTFQPVVYAKKPWWE